MSEADLCASFLANIGPDWKQYPECNGYDFVIVHTSGVQIGVEAKLRANIKVLDQILPKHGCKNVPHYLAVLLPGKCYQGKGGKWLNSLLKKIKVLPVTEFMTFPDFDSAYMKRMLWEGYRRLEMPEYAACVVPGKPSPKKLSVWKINAIRLDFLLLQTGRLTAKQFKEHSQDPRLWVDKGWAVWKERGIYWGGTDGPMTIFKAEAQELIDDLYRIGSDTAVAENEEKQCSHS